VGIIRKSAKEVNKEMRRARRLHPVWPDDQVHQVAKICEESGEALQAANNHFEMGSSIAMIRTEVIHTLGTCYRWLEEND
jgi:hypothetical protein